ncbi:MAG: spondin domain-containing protein [Proteobacteria bacterium]|nr:spondin domain-containing protein [Pseudomonadota bacterium]
MKKHNIFIKFLMMVAVILSFSSQAIEIKIKVENLTAPGGVFFTPVWLGFHDGDFDSYDMGSPASMGLERIAEDGDASVLRSEFSSIVSDGQDAMLFNPEGFAGAPVFEPGSSSTAVFDLDPDTQRYLSYVTMLIPSNDAFIANGDPIQHLIFDASGDFTGPFSFIVYGSQVLDAGTEENTEEDAAFLNQMAANTGVTTNDSVSMHPGFNGSMANPAATPVNILGGVVASGDVIDPILGDFTTQHYRIMRVTVSANSTPIRVAIKNSTAVDGTFLTPFWTPFHDGEFDTYDVNELASEGIERIAEDGNTSVLSAEFANSGVGFDTVITNPAGFEGAPLFDPGLFTLQTFDLNPESNKYFSYVSMILPSNDAFIANANPKAHRLFDDNNNFIGPIRLKIYGNQVLDAGTEANTESDAAFFNQSAPNTGETTQDPIASHPGFNGSVGLPDGSPQVFLGGTNGAGFSFDPTAADFSIEGFQVAEIRVSRLVDGSFSGTWYNTLRSGEGFLIDITEDQTTGELRAVVTWYTYSADGSGVQTWLFGVGPVIADTIIVDMQVTEGAQFGSDFDSNDVISSPWGQLTIKFNGCGNAVVAYEALDESFGSGQTEVQRLTSGPAGFGGPCQF